jgi:hypothetical protein
VEGVERRVRKAEQGSNVVRYLGNGVFAHWHGLQLVRLGPGEPHSPLVELQLVVDFEQVQSQLSRIPACLRNDETALQLVAALLDPVVGDDVALLAPLYLLQLQVHTLLVTQATKEGDNADGLKHKPVGIVLPGQHKLLQYSVIKDSVLLHIIVEAFDEKSESGQVLQLGIVLPLEDAVETRVNSPQRRRRHFPVQAQKLEIVGEEFFTRLTSFEVEVAAEIDKLGPGSLILFTTFGIRKLLEDILVRNDNCHRCSGEFSTASTVC